MPRKEWDRSEDGRAFYRQKYRDYRVKVPERNLLYAAKDRSKKKNLPFDLTLEDIKIPDVCPVLGIPIIKVDFQNPRSDNAPSIDRFDNTKGYTKDNVNIISLRANKIKNHGSIEDFEKIIKWMKEV